MENFDRKAARWLDLIWIPPCSPPTNYNWRAMCFKGCLLAQENILRPQVGYGKWKFQGNVSLVLYRVSSRLTFLGILYYKPSRSRVKIRLWTDDWIGTFVIEKEPVTALSYL